MGPILRLMRAPLAPTAVADILAGAAFMGWRWTSASGGLLVLLGSLGVFHGGMLLNDWADREKDARLRPERPIPAGEIRAGTALMLAVLLLVGGPCLAWMESAQAGSILAGVAVLAGTYDLFARGALAGPLLLGGCRAGNLAAGMALGLGISDGGIATQVPDSGWILCGAYGCAIFAISRLALHEDRPEGLSLGRRPALPILATTLLFLAPGLLLAVHGGVQASIPALILGLLGGLGPLRMAVTTEDWTPALVRAAVGSLLSRLLVWTACVALAAPGGEGLVPAGIILAFLPAVSWMRRRIPVT